MIETIRLRVGRTPGGPPQDIPAARVTVFVGPNNSGKSRILREIHHFCTTGIPNAADVLLDSVSFRSRSAADAEHLLQVATLKPQRGEAIRPDYVTLGGRGRRNQLERAQMVKALSNPNEHVGAFAQYFLYHQSLMLDGQSRIGLVDQQAAGDLQHPADTSFQTLFRDDDLRAEVRRVIHDAFGLHLVIDPTHLGHLRLRLSEAPPGSSITERGIHDEAVQFHANALPIEHGSDGVKAFAGMITEIVAGNPVLLFIDEPEAFLHPSLSFKLGKDVASLSAATDKNVFIATHSAEFVTGCIQSGAPRKYRTADLSWRERNGASAPQR